MLQDDIKRHFETYVDAMTQGERAAAYAAGEKADHIPSYFPSGFGREA